MMIKGVSNTEVEKCPVAEQALLCIYNGEDIHYHYIGFENFEPVSPLPHFIETTPF